MCNLNTGNDDNLYPSASGYKLNKILNTKPKKK